jgi:hypothetical protein
MLATIGHGIEKIVLMGTERKIRRGRVDTQCPRAHGWTELVAVAGCRMPGKAGANPTELIADRSSHHRTGIDFWILIENDAICLAAHSGDGHRGEL